MPSSAGSARDQILNAAERCFAQHGLSVVTLADIAREAGLRPPSIYYYFKSKPAIISAIAERSFAPAISLLGFLAREPAPAVEQFYRYLRLAALTLLMTPLSERMLHHELIRLASGDSTPYRKSLAEVEGTVRRLIEKAIQEEYWMGASADVVLLMADCLISGLVSTEIDFSTREPSRLATFLVDRLFVALGCDARRIEELSARADRLDANRRRRLLAV